MRRFLFACITALASITPATAHHPAYHPPAYRVWWHYSYHTPRPVAVRVVVVKVSKPVPRDPERVYTPRQLERWAESHGYVREDDRDE